MAIVTAFNKLVTERAGANVASRSCASTSASCASEEIVANARLVWQTLCDTSELEQEKAALGQELAVLVEMTQNCIAENARIAQDQEEYQKRYNGLVERYEKAKARFDEVTDTIAQRSAKGERLATLEAQREPVAEFDEQLWGASDGGLCNGGRGRRHDGGVPRWDGYTGLNTCTVQTDVFPYGE